MQIENYTVSWQKLPSHPGGSVAYRVEREHDAQSFSYITDTTVDNSYTDFIRQSDLLIHECYFDDELQQWAEKTGHSFKSQVLELARQAEVKKLLLTHIDPQQPVKDPFNLKDDKAVAQNVATATDLMIVEL